MNRPDEGAPLWTTATVSIGDDGFDFRTETIRTTTAEEATDREARFIDVPVNGSGKFVRIRLQRARPSAWILIAEVKLEGRISRDQAPRTTPR